MVGVAARPLTDRWAPRSRLFLVSDGPGWTIAGEMWELAAIARRFGISVPYPRLLQYSREQAAFYGSHFDLLQGDWPGGTHRLATTYFHGRPGTGVAAFDRVYQRLCQVHSRIERVQVSHSEMYQTVLASGIAPRKVFLIRIGVNLSHFSPRTAESSRAARARLGIPEAAVVVGSFHKDGVGWREGLEPKLEKGPDVFLKAVELLHRRFPQLFVLLTGPARGYVKAGLARLGVPYRHDFVRPYAELVRLYHALDVYVVASRQEGGPKAILESMASAVPVVTTRVGQAMDLVVHGQNGWMVDVEDAEGLAHWTEHVITHRADIDDVLLQGRRVAEANTYESQIPLWREFLGGLVYVPSADVNT